MDSSETGRLSSWEGTKIAASDPFKACLIDNLSCRKKRKIKVSSLRFFISKMISEIETTKKKHKPNKSGL
jgi:hypothetical protein